MRDEHLAKLEIQTPEGVSFTLPLAGPVPRMLAFCIDMVVVQIVSNLIMIPLSVFFAISPDHAMALQILATFVIAISYGILLEWGWRGQTLGKRLLRIRVMDEEGLRLEASQVIIRNLFRFVDMLPALYMFGGVVMMLNSRLQRLGDIAGNTIVTRMPRPDLPNLEQIVAGKYNSFREHPHLAARLRQAVNPREASIALRALIRREHMDPDARLSLFADLRRHFETAVDFPQEAVEGLSDEQYVRNTVDVLYNKR